MSELDPDYFVMQAYHGYRRGEFEIGEIESALAESTPFLTDDELRRIQRVALVLGAVVDVVERSLVTEHIRRGELHDGYNE